MKNLKDIEKIKQLLMVEKKSSIFFYVLLNIFFSVFVGLVIAIIILLIVGVITYIEIFNNILEILRQNIIIIALISIFQPMLWLFPLLTWKDIKKIKKQNKKYEKSRSEVKNMVKENPEIINDLNEYIKKLSNHEITIHYKFEFTEELVDKDYFEREKFIKRKYEASEEFSKYFRIVLTRRELKKLLELK